VGKCFTVYNKRGILFTGSVIAQIKPFRDFFIVVIEEIYKSIYIHSI
jgi:hypothetical protein